MNPYEDDNNILEIGDEELDWDLEDADLDDEEAAAWEDGALAMLGEHHAHTEPEAKYDRPEEENDQPEEYPYRDYVDDEMPEVERCEEADEDSAPAHRLSFLDIAIVLAGAAVIVLASLTYIQYYRMQAVAAEAAQFATLGENLAGAGTIGEAQIEAIATHRKAADAARAEAEADAAELAELAENEGTVPVTMTLSTIQSDLKVKFRSEGGYLISNVPFKVSLSAPSGKTSEYEDEDQDGVIHLTGLASGTYNVTMEPLVDKAEAGAKVTETEAYRNYSQYQIPTDTQSIAVTDKIAYEAVDVSDEIKSASEVNVAAEDTQHKMATESSLQDTVEWVASSETTTMTTTASTESAEAATTEAAEAASTEASTEGASDGSEDASEASTGMPEEAVEVTDGSSSEGAGEASTGMPTEAVEVTTKYTGWQNIDGKTYYYNSNGDRVTGNQVINGAPYTFDANGVLQSGTSSVGIDVSVWNGSIDWSQVANSGVSYAIIRCGYRGSSTGALIRDSSFSSNIAGATAAGLKVGIYVFSQAVNEIEAVEEASMAIELAAGYNVRLPIFIDVEAAGGRADGLSSGERTAVVSAFCRTVQAAGYSAGVYSNTNWFTERINTTSLTNYHIWVAQYASALSYSRTRYDIWQYSSKGHVAGISGDVDMNMAYRAY